MTLLTALEIFTNPTDLYFAVGHNENEPFAFIIMRGPGHNYKMMISTKPVFKSKEEAVDKLVELMEDTCKVASAELDNPATMVAQVVNPEGKPMSEANILSPERILEIKEKLLAEDTASTWEMWPEKVPAG